MSGPLFSPRYSAETVPSEADGRLHSPVFERNWAPITEGLRPMLEGRRGAVLELGCGTGQHIAHWAREFPDLTWVPTDIHPEHHRSVAAWGRALGVENLAAPLDLDASQAWADVPRVAALGPLAAVLAVNVIHITPWAVAEGVVAGAARALAPGSPLVLYGPFRRGGAHTAPSNAEFDAALRAENPDWGVRDLDEVAALADAAGLGPTVVKEMPANNLLVAFPRR